MAISLVAMVTATLNLFLDVVFELIEARILFYIFYEIYDFTTWECYLFTLCRFENCFIAN